MYKFYHHIFFLSCPVFSLGTSVAIWFSKDETTGNIYYTSIDELYEYHVEVITPSGDSITLVDVLWLYGLGSIAVHPGIG